MFNRIFPRLRACILFFVFYVSSTNLVAEESFLVINGITNETVVELGNVNERISPCSTFKITLAAMGYDAGILEDENNPVWNFEEGYDDFLESWKGALTPRSWMQYSCLWYSKLIALKLGSEKIQSYLALMEYGNKDISAGLTPPGPKNVPWINSSLTISPTEQVAFIQKLVCEKLPISSHAARMTKAILFKEELPEGWRLFGKTGWSGSSITKDGKTLEHGWFVGWIEKDHQFFPFAYLIHQQKINLDQRIPRVKELLRESNIAPYVKLPFLTTPKP